MTPTLHGAFSQRIAAGERLQREDIEQLAATHDILAVGMLADQARRLVHGTRVTFVRVASCPFDRPLTEIPPAASEVRLTGTPESLDAAIKAVQTVKAIAAIDTISPLPMVLDTFRRTTGYEDVKMVALSRLAAPAIRHVQVDWQRYGPKLAQVALIFGADDLDHVPPSDDAPDGRRRAVLEEIRRNIEAAGFTATERRP